LTAYLDTSVVVSLLLVEDHGRRARDLVAAQSDLIISDLTAAAFASALAIQYRRGRVEASEARTAFALFDKWCGSVPRRIEVTAADVRSAEAIIRQLDHALKAPDATHISIARRLGASLATFDTAMMREAVRLGVPAAEG
jgi:uncharacterized protein